jgi:hypothetical protein
MVAQLDRTYIGYNPAAFWPRILSYALFEGRPLTTKGQWLNPLVLAGYKFWSRWPARTPVDAPIMLYGQGRSGTTLVGRALGLHRDVAFLNEPKALWHCATGDDDLIGTYSDRPGKFCKTAQDATPEKCRRLKSSYKCISALTGRARIVDKYPEQLFRDDFLLSVFPDARRVVLLRDPYQAAQSVANWSARHGSESSDWWGKDSRKWHLLCDQVLRRDQGLRAAHARLGSFTRQEDRAALEWLACARRAIQLIRQDPDRVQIVLFDTLCQQPVHTMRSVLAFCNLPPDDRVLAFARDQISPPKAYETPQLDPVIRDLIEQTLPEINRLQLDPKTRTRNVA